MKLHFKSTGFLGYLHTYHFFIRRQWAVYGYWKILSNILLQKKALGNISCQSSWNEEESDITFHFYLISQSWHICLWNSDSKSANRISIQSLKQTCQLSQSDAMISRFVSFLTVFQRGHFYRLTIFLAFSSIFRG